MTGTNRHSLGIMGSERDVLRSGILFSLLRSLKSLDCTTTTDQDRLVRLLQPVFKNCSNASRNKTPATAVGVSINDLTELLVGHSARVSFVA